MFATAKSRYLLVAGVGNCETVRVGDRRATRPISARPVPFARRAAAVNPSRTVDDR